MSPCLRFAGLLFIALSLVTPAAAQSLGGPGLSGAPDGKFTSTRSGTAPFDVSATGLTELNSRMLTWPDQQISPLQNPHLLSSKLDAKAPSKARQAFEKGYQLLFKKDYQGAVVKFTDAINIYPEFVAAHQALGSAYLATGKNEEARDEFAQAVVLDNRMPASYFDLGRAELELKHFGSAEIAEQKAAAIAPLDLKVLSTLAYAQLMNRDYPAAVATAKEVHANKDPGHAMIHFYAAAAWEAQKNLGNAMQELHTLLKEDSKSDVAIQARNLLGQFEREQANGSAAYEALVTDIDTSPQQKAQKTLEEKLHQENDKREAQISEAEAICETCDEGAAPTVQPRMHMGSTPGLSHPEMGWTLHSKVDEVAVFFVATDHGKPVRVLNQAQVTVLDNGKAPASIVAFRSENELPLRLGLVIDASSSVRKRFAFEQASASEFMKKVLVGSDDLAFAIGVSNSVVLVQDFTPDASKLSEGINSMVPAGGTTLWDAVAFGADKLATRQETQPVARVLVVISDGQDNSSKKTLKEAIETAERDGVSVYTISTSDVRYLSTALLESTVLGNRALRTLAERTGGTAFAPGSVRNLDSSLSDLEEFIHSRYLVAYKPPILERVDRYRTIDIAAEKDGHKLKVYARKGYYVGSAESEN
jgi:Ca-activated chloride channel homolog